MKRFASLLIMLCSFHLYGHPFDYDLHLTYFMENSPKTMICFHGMGGDYRVAEHIHGRVSETLISFNFPDHGFIPGVSDITKTTFGTINELLPALYVLKKAIIDEGRGQVNLYGFSAGGGALINTLKVLNSSTYDVDLAKIGITSAEKALILDVIQRGHIILDTPLKSIAEIVAFRGATDDLMAARKRYHENGMEPIESIEQLDNLALNIVVHFQNPDETLSNRDDELFIDRLKKHNTKGTTTVIIESDAGHRLPHPSLWRYYSVEAA